MRLAKSIDELYNEVKEFDMVLTNDAALATALNSRVDTPRIGGFAYTPRLLASMDAPRVLKRGISNDLKLINSICDITGYNLKTVHGELENIRSIRRYTADVAKYMYTRTSKNIYDAFTQLPTLEKVMSTYDTENSPLYAGKDVAVIGVDLFDDLDKHMIPYDFEDVDIFRSGKYEIETINEIGNDRQLAENVVSLIDKENIMDVAIVLDTSGPIADAVRSALYRKSIPFKNTLDVKDLSQIRDYLQLLSLSLSYETIRGRHVRELFAVYGGNIKSEKDDYLLTRIHPTLKGKNATITDVMRDIRDLTFMEVCERIVGTKQAPQVKILIDDMGISDEKVTSLRVNELTYAVNNITDLRHNEIIPEDEKKGVLLVDCKRSVFVDRPVIIYLGLGHEWATSLLGKDYMDKEQETFDNMLKFSALLQQGTSRIYAVNAMKDGKEARPCTHFDGILRDSGEEGSSERFADVCKNIVKGAWSKEDPEVIPVRGEMGMEREPEYDWKFTKSTFNNFMNCPRAFLFNDILPYKDSDASVFGNIIHDFAEFYICYPEIYKEYGLEYYIDLMVEKYSGLSYPQMMDVDSSSIRICVSNVQKFIDYLRIESVPLDVDANERKYKNWIMEHHGCTKYSSIVESGANSEVNPLYGKFDLIVNGKIFDYKTGKPHDTNDIGKRMTLDKKPNYVEFQPLIYLLLSKDCKIGPPYEFVQFYAKENAAETVVDEDYDIRRNLRHVILTNESRWDIIRYNEDIKNDFNANVRKKYDLFIDVVAGCEKDVEDPKNDNEILLTIFGHCGLNDNKTNREKFTSGLNKIRKLLHGPLSSGDTLLIPPDELELFTSLVNKKHKLASQYIMTDFPAEPLKDCNNCKFLAACTRNKIITEEEEDE